VLAVLHCGRDPRLWSSAPVTDPSAMGRQRPASDIDLTLIGAAIGFGTLARIEAELDDLLLPWMIDLSRLADLSHPPRRWARLNQCGASHDCDRMNEPKIDIQQRVNWI
jgi:hypothetical protein